MDRLPRTNKPQLNDTRSTRKIRKEFHKRPSLYGLRDKLLFPEALTTDGENSSKVLYECHELCACQGYRCSNMIATEGSRVKLEIFLTENKGWGVRASQGSSIELSLLHFIKLEG